MNLIQKGVQILYTVKDNATDALKNIKARLDKLDNIEKINKAFSQFNANLLALKQAVNGAISTFKSLVNVFAEQEKASAKLTQSLKNQGIESKTVQKEIEDYSSALQQASVFGDELITTVQAGLVTVGLQGDELKRATQATLDFASATGTDLVSAGKLMEKAAAGNVSVLSRYGITVKDTGDKSKDFANALSQLEGRYEGMAKAVANTPTGKLVQFTNSWGDLKEEMGKVLVNALAPVIEGLTRLLNAILNAPASIKLLISGIGVMVIAFFALIPVVTALIPILGTFGITLSAAIWPITAVVAGVIALVGAVALLMTAMAPAINKLEKNSEAIEKNRQALEKAKKEYGENSKQVAKYIKELEKLEKKQAQLKDRAITEETNRLTKEGKTKDEAKTLAVKNVENTISTGTEKQTKVNTEQTDFSKGFSEFAKNEQIRTQTAEEQADLRKKIAEDEAKSFVDLENMKSELSAQKAEADLLNTENKLAALDAYYLAQQEKYAGNEEALAELELFYSEQKLQLEQQHIQQIEAMKDEQYLQQKNRETKTLNDFVKNMDFRKQMSKSQAEDFSKWESFMANASSSESKEIAAIGKALSIYNIGVKTAEAAMGAYNAMAAIPVVGPGLGIAAAAAAIAFGAEQARNVEKQQMALAAGGTFTATQPTTGRIGNQDILFGEAGDEAVSFTPLSDNDSSESSGPRPCYIVIEGYARDQLVEALYYSTAEWKRRGGLN